MNLPSADALALTHARAFAVDRPWSASEFEELLQSKGVLLIGDERSFVLGRVTFDEAEILTLATDPTHQRKGLARAALDAFAVGAANLGADRVFLDVAEDNDPALALYTGAGFVEIARRRGYFTRTEGAVAALVMQRIL